MSATKIWDDVAEAYDKDGLKITGPFCEWAVETSVPLVPSTSSAYVLDVACGSGAVAFTAAKKFGKVLATDFAPGMVAVVERKAQEGQVKNIQAQVQDATDLKLADNSFDAVFCAFGVMLMPPDVQAKAMKEMFRVLKPGAPLVLATWRSDSPFQHLMFSGVPKIQAAMQAAPDTPSPFPAEAKEADFKSWTFTTPEATLKHPVLAWGEADFARKQLSDAGFVETKAEIKDAETPVYTADTFVEMLVTAAGPLKSVFEGMPLEKQPLFTGFWKQHYLSLVGPKPVAIPTRALISYGIKPAQASA